MPLSMIAHRSNAFRRRLLLIGLLSLPACGGRVLNADPPAESDSTADARVSGLIAVLSDREANGGKLEATRKAIAGLVEIGAPAAPHLIKVIIEADPKASGTFAGNGPAYSALALDRMDKPAIESVRLVWDRLNEADRWKLMPFRGRHDYAAALPFALTSLDSKSDDIVGQAAGYLGIYQEAQARGPLLKKLNTAAPRVRWEVLDALALLGGDDVVDAVIRLLEKGSWAAKGEGLDPPDGGMPPWWPDGRPRVIAALRTLRATKSTPAVVTVLREKGEGRAYMGDVIVPFLLDQGGPECLAELNRIKNADPETLAPSVRRPDKLKGLAGLAMNYIEHRPRPRPAKEAPPTEARVQELIAVLSRPDAGTHDPRERTGKAIAELVGMEAFAAPHLIKVIVEADPKVIETFNGYGQAYSALALDEMGGPAVESVRRAWDKLDEAGRWKLMRFRGRHDYPAALSFAVASLDSKSDDIVGQAARYLGKYQEARGRQALLATLNTAALKVRWDALEALTKVGGPGVAEAYIQLLDKNSWAAKGEGLSPPPGVTPPWWPDGRPRVIEVLHTLKAKKAAGPALRLLQAKGTKLAYLGDYIIPLLSDQGRADCLPVLWRIAAARDEDIALSLHGPEYMRSLARKAAKVVAIRTQ